MPPRRGHLVVERNIAVGSYVSTRAPAKGASSPAFASQFDVYVSTRAPAKGASLAYSSLFFEVAGFNSCPREGGIS